MALTVNQLGDNPQQPGIYAETYIPDQLIAGRHPLITDSVTITGSAALQRGSLLGRVSVGTISASTGTAQASGTIAVAAVPSDGDTITIGGTVVTMKAANPAGNQVLIGATTAATAQNILNFLVGSSDANLIKFRYSLSSSTITFKAVALGTGGNSLTLATSNGTAFTVSGATLSGGVANTGNATVGSISAGTAMKAGTYTAVCLTATTANVFDPQGDLIGPLTFGSAFANAQINFTITAGGTPCQAGDSFALNAAPASGSYKLAHSDAVDGSQNPVAILADYSDASGGDVTGAIYVAGEFNFNAMTVGRGYTLTGLKPVLAPLGIFLKSPVTANDPS